MLLDDDNKILNRPQLRFVKEIQKELTPLVGIVGDEIRAAGMTIYKSLTLVYYDCLPSWINVNFDRDWTYNLNRTNKENVDQIIQVILEKINRHGIASSWDKLSVYNHNSYLSKNTRDSR